MLKTNAEIRMKSMNGSMRTYLGPLNLDDKGEPDKTKKLSIFLLKIYTLQESASKANKESGEDIFIDTYEDFMESDSVNNVYDNNSVDDDDRSKKQKKKAVDDDEKN